MIGQTRTDVLSVDTTNRVAGAFAQTAPMIGSNLKQTTMETEMDDQIYRCMIDECNEWANEDGDMCDYHQDCYDEALWEWEQQKAEQAYEEDVGPSWTTRMENW